MVFNEILKPRRSPFSKILEIDDELDFEDIKRPVKIKDIHKILY